MVKAVCIDGKNIPKDFPNKSKWVKEGVTYTLTRVLFVKKSNVLGVELNEIDLNDCEPYKYFNINRFGITDLDGLKELIQACKEEQEVNCDELIETLVKEYEEV